MIDPTFDPWFLVFMELGFGHRNSGIDCKVPLWIFLSSFSMLYTLFGWRVSVTSTRFPNGFMLRTWVKISSIKCLSSAHIG